MWYLIRKTDLEDLLGARTNIEKLTEPDNLCLITFTGADMRLLLDKKGIKLSKKRFADLLYKISHDLEHYDCWACLESALGSEIEAYVKKR
jgi:hypothetical protein